MQHIFYDLALNHRAELLREAAMRRLVSHSTQPLDGAVRHARRPGWRGLRLRQLHLAIRG
jgi:hypothetical protein